uniref:Uncharacterized protein n=1 Tax=Chromera velia CCMP2878 TaxID=1169474 RepID=A0A0G4IB94_9ALVE|eukprot:Cvel_2142.t1-p1 / transcript=Cvel_2142.t1 / gene=Cvel_2142 / organism=Chromera_velia_CCMP2878 / gene_product=hypothetical protein / transcript_product=hypothetical protein / location=Cvel_scaffold83:41297-45123(+) / protein_length=631 / sequence_SO=supercontig / SO=protein_coding / is_pseudo=false
MTSLENADKEIQPEVLFYSNRSGLRASLCIHAIVTGACFISMYYFAIVDRPKMFEIEMRMAGSQMAPDEIAAHKYAVAIQGAVGVSLLSVVDFIYFAMGWRAVNTDRHVHRKLREFFWTAVLEALLAAFLCIFIRVSEGYQAVQALSKTLLALSAHHASDIVYRLHIRRRRAPSYFACFSPIGAPKRWTSSHARSPPPTEALPPVVEDDAEGLHLSIQPPPPPSQSHAAASTAAAERDARTMEERRLLEPEAVAAVSSNSNNAAAASSSSSLSSTSPTPLQAHHLTASAPSRLNHTAAAAGGGGSANTLSAQSPPPQRMSSVPVRGHYGGTGTSLSHSLRQRQEMLKLEQKRRSIVSASDGGFEDAVIVWDFVETKRRLLAASSLLLFVGEAAITALQLFYFSALQAFLMDAMSRNPERFPGRTLEDKRHMMSGMFSILTTVYTARMGLAALHFLVCSWALRIDLLPPWAPLLMVGCRKTKGSSALGGGGAKPVSYDVEGGTGGEKETEGGGQASRAVGNQIRVWLYGFQILLSVLMFLADCVVLMVQHVIRVPYVAYLMGPRLIVFAMELRLYWALDNPPETPPAYEDSPGHPVDSRYGSVRVDVRTHDPAKPLLVGSGEAVHVPVAARS